MEESITLIGCLHAFFMDQLDTAWILYRYIPREHGVVVAGPDPRTLEVCKRALAAAPSPAERVTAKAVGGVIVDDPRGLHPRVDNDRADERKAPLL